MTPPQGPTTPPPATSGSRSYTSIPISPADVMSRSLHNLIMAVSTNMRPWPELIASSGACSGRSSPFAFGLLANLQYFRTNYTIILCACGALSLIGFPASLLIFLLLSSLWLLLYFREDPLLLWRYHLTDRCLFFGLIFLSFLWVWFCGRTRGSLLLGLLSGLSLCALHAFFKDSPALLQQQEHESLISSGYGNGSYGAIAV